MPEAKTTRDHDVIKRWAEARGGHPATVAGTGKGREAGILRLDFDPKDQGLKELSWDSFFEKFDRENLCFLYQDETEDGGESRFHKFINA